MPSGSFCGSGSTLSEDSAFPNFMWKGTSLTLKPGFQMDIWLYGSDSLKDQAHSYFLTNVNLWSKFERSMSKHVQRMYVRTFAFHILSISSWYSLPYHCLADICSTPPLCRYEYRSISFYVWSIWSSITSEFWECWRFSRTSPRICM
jgi:hypothetical protein